MSFHVSNPVGKEGENEIVAYLKKNHFDILERNYRKHYGEIDIIALDKREKEHVLLFIEVKTRTSAAFGTPFEAITPWQMKPLIQTAQLYTSSNPHLPTSLRIDAISVVVSENL